MVKDGKAKASRSKNGPLHPAEPIEEDLLLELYNRWLFLFNPVNIFHCEINFHNLIKRNPFPFRHLLQFPEGSQVWFLDYGMSPSAKFFQTCGFRIRYFPKLDGKVGEHKWSLKISCMNGNNKNGFPFGIHKVSSTYEKDDLQALVKFVSDELTSKWDNLRNTGAFATVPRESTLHVDPTPWSSILLKAFKTVVDGTRFGLFGSKCMTAFLYRNKYYSIPCITFFGWATLCPAFCNVRHCSCVPLASKVRKMMEALSDEAFMDFNGPQAPALRAEADSWGVYVAESKFKDAGSGLFCKKGVQNALLFIFCFGSVFWTFLFLRGERDFQQNFLIMFFHSSSSWEVPSTLFRNVVRPCGGSTAHRPHLSGRR